MVALETAQMISPLCNADATYGEVLDSYDDTDGAEADPQRTITDWAESERTAAHHHQRRATNHES